MSNPSELLTEDVITLADVVEMLPRTRRGKKLHRATAFRWATRGILRHDGQRIRLETVNIGARLFTSRQAARRFLDRISDRSDGEIPTVRSVPQARCAAERAGRRLASQRA